MACSSCQKWNTSLENSVKALSLVKTLLSVAVYIVSILHAIVVCLPCAIFVSSCSRICSFSSCHILLGQSCATFYQWCENRDTIPIENSWDIVRRRIPRQHLEHTDIKELWTSVKKPCLNI